MGKIKSIFAGSSVLRLVGYFAICNAHRRGFVCAGGVFPSVVINSMRESETGPLICGSSTTADRRSVNFNTIRPAKVEVIDETNYCTTKSRCFAPACEREEN